MKISKSAKTYRRVASEQDTARIRGVFAPVSTTRSDRLQFETRQQLRDKNDGCKPCEAN